MESMTELGKIFPGEVKRCLNNRSNVGTILELFKIFWPLGALGGRRGARGRIECVACAAREDTILCDLVEGKENSAEDGMSTNTKELGLEPDWSFILTPSRYFLSVFILNILLRVYICPRSIACEYREASEKYPITSSCSIPPWWCLSLFCWVSIFYQ